MADRTRIAVVLIHGIGEPRPMEAITSFVDAIASADPQGTAGSWSLPFAGSSLYDIRRITISGTRTRPVVDFYELYWAHLLKDTKLEQVLRWLFDLVRRPVDTVPQQLHWVYLFGWSLFAVLGLTCLLLFLFFFFALPGWLPAISTVVTLVYGLFSYQVLGTLGDAARYLDMRPDNVEARNAIQKAGVDLLELLHDEARGYRRIVVVGHSLGSMIGYDVLRQAWYSYSSRYRPVDGPRRKAIDAWRRAAADAGSSNTTEPLELQMCRDLQSHAWAEHIANGGEWRVTDFVTLGSPLTYAALLMANGPADFAHRTTGRVLATCPPTADPKFGLTRDLAMEAPGGKKARVRTPDHAGAFAYTRWTNIYSPASYLIHGDILSGPLSPVFGKWIKDISVHASHVGYWRSGTDKPTAGTVALVTALDLSGRDAAYAPAQGVELGSAEGAPRSD